MERRKLEDNFSARQKDAGSESSSDSYSSSGSEDEFGREKAPRKREEEDYPITRTTVAAQESQRKRIALKSELASMLQEHAALTSTIAELQEKIDSIQHGGARTSKKRVAPTTALENGHTSGSSGDAERDGKDDSTDSEHKKVKTKESSDGGSEHHSAPTPQRATARGALGNPLFQRLLMGTLQKSKKEIELEQADKHVRISMCSSSIATMACSELAFFLHPFRRWNPSLHQHTNRKNFN
jgi:transposase